MKPAYYLLIDVKATCDEQGRIPRHETEIIEIGAVLVDGKTLEPVDELDLIVKPVIHPVLTPFCVQLTTVRQGDVDDAPGFRSVRTAGTVG